MLLDARLTRASIGQQTATSPSPRIPLNRRHPAAKERLYLFLVSQTGKYRLISALGNPRREGSSVYLPMKRLLYLAASAAILTSACTTVTPLDKTSLTSVLCSSERPEPRTYMPGEDGPSGLLSPSQALERAKKAAEEQLLEFESATLRFDPCHTWPQILVDVSEPTITPVWIVNMRGTFEVFDDDCIVAWQIILDARTGDDYQSGEGNPYRRTDCSPAG